MDCARAAILLPLGSSILNCQPMTKCSLVETAFLLLVTVSTVNMLTTVLNDSPIFPETDEEADLAAPLLMDSPQASAFFFHSLSLSLPLSHASFTLFSHFYGLRHLLKSDARADTIRNSSLVVFLFFSFLSFSVLLFLLYSRERERERERENGEDFV